MKFSQITTTSYLFINFTHHEKLLRPSQFSLVEMFNN